MAIGRFFHNSECMQHLGLHTTQSHKKANLHEFGKSWRATQWNIQVALNVIFGPLVGIFHIVKAIMVDGPKDWKLVGRGVAEIFLSPLVAVADLVATIGRAITKNPYAGERTVGA